MKLLRVFTNKTGRRSTHSVSGDIVMFIILAALAAFMMLPFVYSIMQSLKPEEEIFLFPPRFFVRQPTLDNYIDLFKYSNSSWVPFTRYAANSIFASIVAVAGQLIVSSMAAFVLSKTKIRGRVFIFSMVVSTLMFSAEALTVPLYYIMGKMGIINTSMSLTLPAIAAPLGVFLLKQYMETVPDAVIESAKVDGAKPFTIYARIVMPMVKPGWLTLIIFTFQNVWNFDTSAYIFDEQLKMLPVMLRQIASAGIARTGMSAAAAVILLIPPIIIFLISQSRVLETMSHSGIK